MTSLPPDAECWEPLADCEMPVRDGTFYRQVRPDCFDEDMVTWKAFRTSDADAGKLSGSTSAQQSPQDAYERYAELEVTPGTRTIGTWGVEVADVEGVLHGLLDDCMLRVVDDDACPTDPQRPAVRPHAYLDERPLLGNSKPIRQTRQRARERLAAKAITLYRPPGSGSVEI